MTTGDLRGRLCAIWGNKPHHDGTAPGDVFWDLATSHQAVLQALGQASVQEAEELWSIVQGRLINSSLPGSACPRELKPAFEELPGLWRLAVACAGLAACVRSKDSSAAEQWLQRVFDQCGGSDSVPPPAAEWANGSVPDQAFLDLQSRVQNLTMWLEAWDLVTFLATGKRRQAGTHVDMRVLFVENNAGRCGTLRLERLKEGAGFVRAPEMLLMPCCSDARTMFDRAWTVAAPSKGSVRWTLTLGDFADGAKPPTVPSLLVGPSLGGALAVGLKLLQDPEPLSDLTVAITAELADERGSLQPVAHVTEKLAAALSTAWPISVLLVAKGQKAIRADALKEVANVVEAHTEFRNAIAPLRSYRGCIQGRFQYLRLLDVGKRDEDRRMDRLYQDIPLLREVDPEELERRKRELERRADTEERGESGAEALRTLLRYEEYQGLVQPSSERADVVELLKQGARFVVLGPPGSGKTTLLQHATLKLLDTTGENTLLPLFVSLSDWESSKKGLFTYCAEDDKLKTFGPSAKWPSADQFKSYVERGRAALLLDGLDEVTSSEWIQDVLRPTLRDYQRCPLVITCRTISRYLVSNLGEDRRYPVFTPDELSRAQQTAYVQAYPFTKDPSRQALLNALDTLSHLASTPFLLDMLCYVADHLQPNAPFPLQQTAIYHRAVEQMMDRVAAKWNHHGTDWQDLERFVEVLAWHLAGSHDRPTTFRAQTVKDKATEAAGKLSRAPDWGREALGALRQHSRLIAGRATPAKEDERTSDYYFCHTTFLEYLLGAYLARKAAAEGFQAIRDVVDRYSWHPNWYMPMLFLAGRLRQIMDSDTPGKAEEALYGLLELLSAEGTDDIFRHRLGLVMELAPEIL